MLHPSDWILGTHGGTFLPLAMPRRRRSRTDLPPFVREHHNGYRAVFRINGRRRNGPTCATPGEAAKWARDVRATDAKLRTGTPITLGDSLRMVLDRLRETNAREDTFRYYKAHHLTLCRGLGGETMLHRLDATMIRDYIARRAKVVTLSTVVSKEMATLRRIVKLALEERRITRDPFAEVRLPRFRSERFEFLTEQQMADVLARMRAWTRARHRERHAAIVEFFFHTGLRRAEGSRLRPVDVQMEQGRIFVEGKSGDRYQPFGKPLRPVLDLLLAQQRADGHLIGSVVLIDKLFEHWKAKLGLLHFSAHVCRHSYGTAMARRVTPFELMTLMGHRSVKQTARYFHAQFAHLSDALDGLGTGRPATPPDRRDAPTGRDRLEGAAAP